MSERLDRVRRRSLPMYKEVEAEAPLRAFRVSDNSKTGVSLNFAIVGSCTPTRACAEYCYALVGRTMMDRSLRVQHQNLVLANRLETASQEEVDFAADCLYTDVVRSGYDFIRWNGTGDLVPGAVRVLNAFTRRHPKITHWVITRKAPMVRLIEDRPSVFVMVSLDGSETPTRAEGLKALKGVFKKARVRFAWVRRYDDVRPAPRGTFVTFNEHRQGYRYGDDDRGRACPATVPGGLEHDGACPTCRRCFTA